MPIIVTILADVFMWALAFLFEAWLIKIVWEAIAPQYDWPILHSYWHYVGIIAIFSGVFHSGASNFFNRKD